MALTGKTLKSSRPNGHSIRLVERALSDTNKWWEVQTLDEDGYWTEDQDVYETLAEAEAYYALFSKELSETPNWEAQAAYDEAHGTYMGYSEHDYMSREY